MANPTLTLPDIELDMLDDLIEEKINRRERPQKHSRSSELRALVQQHILANRRDLEESEDWELYEVHLDSTDGFGDFPTGN